MYEPGTGRWLNEDPIGFDAGDPNLYRYVGNEPTDATDPSGKFVLYITGRGGAILDKTGIVQRMFRKGNGRGSMIVMGHPDPLVECISPTQYVQNPYKKLKAVLAD